MLLDYTYRYDGNGNRTSKAGASNVSRHAGNDSSIGNTSYSYDSLQRLQEVSYPTGTVEKFAYDNAGNRILKKYGTADNFKTGSYLEERYRYDNKNRLLESRNPQNVTYYQYDKQGNTISELTKRYLTGENKEAQSVQYAAGMTEKQDSIMQELGQQEVQHGNRTLVSHSVEKTELQQYKTYAYNSFNKASKVTVENYTNGEKAVDIHENFYDAENMRYSIKENGTTTNFVTNGWSVFTELDAEWKPTKRLVRGYGIVASEEVGTTTVTDRNGGYSNGYHYYHQNEHGDIEYITGKDGKIENAYTYDAFGNITNSTELVKNRYTYNGEQYDKTTSQYYLRARYYNPLVARFTQEDVYRGDGLNLYAYCGNNPVMYVDPSGYSKKCGTDSESGNYSSLRDLMSPEEVARYDEHWLDVAEKISNEALDNQIDFIKNGGITRQNGKIYEPSKVCCAVDLNTGKPYIGYSGKRGMNPSKPVNGQLESELQIRVDRTKEIAKNTIGNPYADRSSFYTYPVDNCAEVFATNNALLGGADIDNIFLNTRNFWSEEYAPLCDNCKITFENFKLPKNK